MPPELRFSNIDLHVHTPASRYFIEQGVKSDMIVHHTFMAGLQAIFNTDHNTAEWIDQSEAVAEDQRLVVFPRVEITVQPGANGTILIKGCSQLLKTKKLRTNPRHVH